MRNINVQIDRFLNAAVILCIVGIIWHLQPFVDTIIPISSIIFGIIAVRRTDSKWAFIAIIVSSLVLIVDIIRGVLEIINMR